MSSNTDPLDRMLREELASDAEPDEQLNINVINRFKEKNDLRPKYKRKISIGIMVAVFTLILSASAFAAEKLFNSHQVAKHLGYEVLAEAFSGREAIELNESVTSGGYKITLHGIVSGAGLQELEGHSGEIAPEKSYAVVSIANADGRPMPKTSDPDYGEVPFFVSPLIKGLIPWQVNIYSLHGGYSETVLDGVMYRLIECDEVEMFANRETYLAVVSGSRVYSSEAMDYDEKTGEIRVRPDYMGASVLFDLPLDKTKADPAKAEDYLEELQKPFNPEENSEEATEMAKMAEEKKKKIEVWEQKLMEGTTIPESVQALLVDDLGRIRYEFNDIDVTMTIDQIFEDGQTGDVPYHFYEIEGKVLALVFTRGDEGEIIGRVVEIVP